jgi:hypothetical protein
MPKYKFMGDHAVEIVKGDKNVMLGPYEFIELTAKEMEDNAHYEELFLAAEKGGGDK